MKKVVEGKSESTWYNDRVVGSYVVGLRKGIMMVWKEFAKKIV